MVQVWEVATGKELARFRGHWDHYHNCLAFSPDGQRLAFSVEPPSVEVWDLVSRRRLSTFSNHTGRVMDVAFSPDGTRVASGGVGKPQPDGKLRQPGEAKVWDASTGQQIYDLPVHPLHVAGVTFSPDGKCLVTAGWDRTVRVWELATGKEMLSLGGHPAYVWDVAFSEDGKRLATAGQGGVKLWDWPSGQEILSLRLSGPLGGVARQVAFVAGGKRLVATSPSGVTIWDGSPLDESPDRVSDSRK
jgi:WD40 repeat protein